MRLALREWPGGEPAVLLLHGLASTSRIFDLLAPELSPEFRVAAYDQRGHGESAKPSSGYGFEDLAGDAEAVRRGLRLGRPVVLGHSWGANVALEHAVRYPRSVSGLVLLDGGFLNLRSRMDWTTAKEQMTPPHLAGMRVEEFLALARRRMDGQFEWMPAHTEIVGSMMRIDRDGRIRPRLSLRNHLRIVRALWAQDAIGLLRRVRVPTLVLAVHGPHIVPGEDRWLEAKRDDAAAVETIGEPVTFEWIEGIHDLPIQDPVRLALRLREFVHERIPRYPVRDDR